LTPGVTAGHWRFARQGGAPATNKNVLLLPAFDRHARRRP
jgi:hypothetical protein